jgi:hypothetical protein
MDVSIQTIPVILKPEYAIYMNRYGYPENDIFDPIKLADIVKSLTH